MRLVPITCPSKCFGSDQNTLIESPSLGLPVGLLASPVVVTEFRGTSYVYVVIIRLIDVRLYPHTLLSTVSSVTMNLSKGISKVRAGAQATVSSQTVISSVQEKIRHCCQCRISQVRLMLQKYTTVFSAHENDFSCTNLILHNIPLLHETSVRQNHRHTPPH